ncbi:MAG: hypothetical protein MJ051_06340 [Akkermansia sp.]|nr:hypothetical protein [Akkermansia sp.]
MYQETPRGTLSFVLFGIPVSIHPVSWVMLALIGGGLGIDNKDSLVQTLLFVAAGMVALLAHEFGHALVGRRVGAGAAAITIAGLGGVTQHAYLPPTRGGYFAMVAAGPLASLALGLAAGLLFGLLIGHPFAGLLSAVLMPLPGILPMPDIYLAALADGLHTHPLNPTLLRAFIILMGICFWWTVFNLFPIFPLDGGKLLGTLLHSDFKACRAGLVFSAILFILAALSGSIFNMMITAWIAYINFQYYRALKS